jgi:zinc transporter 1/2/3
MAKSDAHAGHDHRRVLLAPTQPSTASATAYASASSTVHGAWRSTIKAAATSDAAVAYAHAQEALSTTLLPMRRMLHGTDAGEPATENKVEWQYESHSHSFPVAACTILFGFLLALTMQELVTIITAHCITGGRSRRAQPAGCTATSDALPAQGSPQTSNSAMLAAATPPTISAAHADGHPFPTTSHTPESITPKMVAPGRDSERQVIMLNQQRQHALMAVFELGCVVHSFIIGISLGVALPRSEAVALMVALTFHQLLEGIMLGTLLITLSTSLRMIVLAVAAFAVTCPVGVAVGIGIALSYDSHSTAAMASQGVINGVASGMLLYLALCVTGMWVSNLSHTHAPLAECSGEGTGTGPTVLSEERQRPAGGKLAAAARSSVLVRILGLAAYASGMAVFAVLAIWA